MTDTALQRAARMLTNEFVEPLRRQLVGRRVIAENTAERGTGKYSVDIDTITDMSAGEITLTLDEIGVSDDMINVTTERKQIPMPHKSFKVNRQAYNAFMNEGKRIDSAGAASAAYQVGVVEDAMVIQGWKPDGTNYKVQGLFNVTGITTATGADMGTAGNAIVSAQNGISALEDLGVSGPYNMLLHKTQAAQLRGAVLTGAGREMTQVLEMLNMDMPGVREGRVYQVHDMTEDYALVMPVDPNRTYFELINPIEIHTVLGEDSKRPETSPIYGQVYEVMLLNIKQPTAICKVSGV